MPATLNLPSINLPAVFVAAFVHMVVGLIWYQPKVFGDAWAGLAKADLKPSSRWKPVGAIGHLLMALVLASIVNLAGATTMMDGLFIGILVWLGFIVPLEIGELIWEKIPFNLFLIRVGNHLIGFGLAGDHPRRLALRCPEKTLNEIFLPGMRQFLQLMWGKIFLG